MKVLNLPNILTVSRALLIPIIIVGAYSKKTSMLVLTIFLLVLAWIIDYLDGYIARRYELITHFGTFFDPLVDKVLILSLFFVFVDLEFIPMWMPLLLLFREFLVTGVREVGSLRGKVVGSNWMGKMKWNLQVIMIVYTLIYLLAQSRDYTLTFGKEIIYFGTFIVVLLSLIFAFIFLYWNRNIFFQ